MFKKIKQFFTTDILLKFVCLILAVIVWGMLKREASQDPAFIKDQVRRSTP